MVPGLPNPNFAIPVTKMCITNKVNNKKIYALYNPAAYVQGRSTQYSETPGLASNAPSIQFVHGNTPDGAVLRFV